MSAVYIGIHLSIRHGYLAAAKTAARLGLKAYQFFAKNPRSLTVKAYSAKDAEACRQFVREHDIRSIIHSPYPSNLAVEDEELRQLTIRSILNDLEICDACGAYGLVVHFGKYRGADLLRGYQLIIRNLNEILASWSGEALILLENQAGDSRRMGTTLEELTQIRKLCAAPERIGFCFDTCHAFASGIWNGANSAELLSRGEELGYWEHVHAIHLNDSVYASGMFKDRHAPLGEGQIGWRGFASLLSDRKFQQIPHILETPAQNMDAHTKQIYQYLSMIR